MLVRRAKVNQTMDIHLLINIFVSELSPGGGGLPYEEYMGVCHELGSYFQEKIPKRVCQFLTKIPERAIIAVKNSR